jgi:hypothetical protein
LCYSGFIPAPILSPELAAQAVATSSVVAGVVAAVVSGAVAGSVAGAVAGSTAASSAGPGGASVYQLIGATQFMNVFGAMMDTGSNEDTASRRVGKSYNATLPKNQSAATKKTSSSSEFRLA